MATDRQQEILDLAASFSLPASEISDGYHTFGELYRYRTLYHAGMVNMLNDNPYGILIEKSKRHHSGEKCFGGGWFIVIMDCAGNQITNHYSLDDWNLFACREVEIPSKPWDGHTPQEAEERLRKLISTLAEITEPRIRRSGRTTAIAKKALDFLETEGRGARVIIPVGNENLEEIRYALWKNGEYNDVHVAEDHVCRECKPERVVKAGNKEVVKLVQKLAKDKGKIVLYKPISINRYDVYELSLN